MLFMIFCRIIVLNSYLRGIQMENSVKHLPELSAFNVLLCMLVVFIHVSSAPVTGYAKNSLPFAAVLIPWRLSSFAVQGFIFLSGLKSFLNKNALIDYKEFYWRRLIKIIIPYIIWNIIYYLYFIINGYLFFNFPDLIMYILKGTLISPFYFIVVIVQFYALMPLWAKMVKKVHPAIMLMIAAVFTPFMSRYLPDILTFIFPGSSFQYTDRVLTTYLIYWVAGCYAGQYYVKTKELMENSRIFIVTAFAIFMIAESILAYLVFSGRLNIAWLEDIHYIYCISAVLFFFMFFTLFYKKRNLTSIIVRLLDSVSYNIFLLHVLVIFLINGLIIRFGIMGITAAYGIRIVFVYSVTVTVCIFFKKIMQRRHLSVALKK